MSAAERLPTRPPEPEPEVRAKRREFRVPICGSSVTGRLSCSAGIYAAAILDISYSGTLVFVDPEVPPPAIGEVVDMEFHSTFGRFVRIAMTVRHSSPQGLGLQVAPHVPRRALAKLRTIVNEAQREFLRSQRH